MPLSFVSNSSLPDVDPILNSGLSVFSNLRVLRLSVTDLCNFRCHYCMPEGVPKSSRRELPSLEDLGGFVTWLIAQSKIDRIRLTGGEPLVRRGIQHLIAQLSSLPTIREVALTTNGSLLSRMAWDLRAAGLTRVNVSLDSLDPRRFHEITRGGHLRETLDGIEAAQRAGLTPMKLNAVLQRSTWRVEVPSLLNYAVKIGAEIRFIELMRSGTEKAWCESEFVSINEVLAGIHAESLLTYDSTRAPSRVMLMDWDGARVRVGWIAPRSRPFCSRCERIRMDARGQIRRCLMDPSTFDLPRALAKTSHSSALEALRCYMSGKIPPAAMDTAAAMSEIGG